MLSTQLQPKYEHFFNDGEKPRVLPQIDPPMVFEAYGVTIEVTKDRVLTLTGYKKLVFSETGAEVDIVGKNINIKASETLSLEAKHHAVIDADRIDLAPDRDDPDYLLHIRKLKRDGTTSL